MPLRSGQQAFRVGTFLAQPKYSRPTLKIRDQPIRRARTKREFVRMPALLDRLSYAQRLISQFPICPTACAYLSEQVIS